MFKIYHSMILKDSRPILVYSQVIGNNEVIASKERKMKVGCFALIDPFSTLDHQLQRIEDMGFKYADVTDSRVCWGGFAGRGVPQPPR